MRFLSVFLFGLAPLAVGTSPTGFAPAHRVSGIGVARSDMSNELLAERTRLMIESQTFTIMREPQAEIGAQRITSPKLQAIFRSAAARSGMPADVIEAIAYLESWGSPKAESPAGPRGIMQISEATGRRMGLKITYATRYKVTTAKVQTKRRGKTVTKTVKKKTPYTVLVRDDRMLPERAIPAAATYLTNVEQRLGGRDWAIFAYHCGEGCAAEMLDLTRHALGVPHDDVTVARMFFSASPVWNRDLFEALQRNLDRDYSPTYWFRIRRAQQLLALYRKAPKAFAELAADYRSQIAPAPRAPHRLAVWLKKSDLVFMSRDDIRSDSGHKLARAFDRPEFFGYSLRAALASGAEVDDDYQLRASPSALGTLTYIAYETRRLHAAMHPKGEHFVPLLVTSLVAPAAKGSAVWTATRGHMEAATHASGEVFDIGYTNLPKGELEALRFVLDDLGWDGYLGFVEEGAGNLHIGCSPGSREFFTTVFTEALESAD